MGTPLVTWTLIGVTGVASCCNVFAKSVQMKFNDAPLSARVIAVRPSSCARKRKVQGEDYPTTEWSEMVATVSRG
ncbi:unnamed protein product [Linum trigynum]|uniref:Secreted protein n=1 Tax=Linum trigynum TaxID=586398 RepID=A0AAV2DXJ5_9ROSI